MAQFWILCLPIYFTIYCENLYGYGNSPLQMSCSPSLCSPHALWNRLSCCIHTMYFIVSIRGEDFSVGFCTVCMQSFVLRTVKSDALLYLDFALPCLVSLVGFMQQNITTGFVAWFFLEKKKNQQNNDLYRTQSWQWPKTCCKNQKVIQTLKNLKNKSQIINFESHTPLI